MIKIKLIYSILTTTALCAIMFTYLLSPLNMAVDVSTISPRQSNIELTLACKGKFQRVEGSEIVFKNSVLIKELMIQNGDSVKKGDIIATIKVIGTEEEKVRDLVAAFNSLKKENPELEMIEPYLGEDIKKYFSYDEYSDEDVAIVRSKVDGIICNLNYWSGEILPPSVSLCTIEGDENLYVLSNINEKYIADLYVGQEVRVKADALNEEVRGRISQISPRAVDVFNQTAKEVVVPVEIELLEGSKNIKTGYSAMLNIVTLNKKNAILVPYEAISQNEDNKEVVYREIRGRAVPVEVETGIEMPKEIEIIDGINMEDSLIIIKENIKLEPYKRIKVAKTN